MRILVFSDTHFTDHFDQARFEAISSLLISVDQVIINGDFWDGYSVSFDKFVNSEWKKLFPLLKEKKCIYIYGNHDDIKMSDERRDLFADKVCEKYTCSLGGKDFVFLHGQQYAKTIDMRFRFLVSPFTNGLVNTYFSIGTKLFKEKFWKRKQPQNRRMYEGMSKDYKGIFFTGHSHYMQKIGDNFYNSGLINYGLLQYLIIDDGEVQMVSKRLD